VSHFFRMLLLLVPALGPTIKHDGL
jgi:hypothetical protein